MNYSVVIEVVISLFTLFFLEVILGIDNLVFVAISCSRLPKSKQARARTFGLLLALITRLLLLSCVSWLASFTHPLFSMYEVAFSGRDLLLGIGGIFLLIKGTQEIHQEFDHASLQSSQRRASSKLSLVIFQIALLDIIFSFDSVITAVGMTQQFWIMASAIFLAILVMIVASHPLSTFIEKNPSIKMLAISFIIMVGMILIADSMHYHIPRAYLYFSISFSLTVELLNIVMKNRRQKIH